jgi:protein TonB
MYGHAQNASGRARMSGAMTAALITAATAYAVSVAATKKIVPPVQELTQLLLLAPEKPQEVKPLPVKEEVVVEKPKELVAPPVPPPPQVEPVITAPPAPVEPAPVSAPVGDAAPPRLVVANKPPYPPQSLRAQEEGTTRLEVCVTERGRVQSVVVAGGSGHPRLDEAAARWMRNARFQPGTVGGVPQAMCGHRVLYEWRLEDA